MKVVYIAGVRRGSFIHETLNIIKSAESIAEKYLSIGYGVILPHRNSSRDHLFFNGLLPDNYQSDGYVEILSRCDLVIMVNGWESSGHAKREHDTAVSKGIEIIYDGQVAEKLA